MKKAYLMRELPFDGTAKIFKNPNSTGVLLFTIYNSYIQIYDPAVHYCGWYTYDSGSTWDDWGGSPMQTADCEEYYRSYGYYPNGEIIPKKRMEVTYENFCGEN